MAAATEKQASDQDGSYPNVRKLNEVYGPKAAKKLDDAYEKLRKAGADLAAERLVELDADVPRLDFPALERLAAPEHAADELADAQERRVRLAHTIRNALALIPLLATWYALAGASLKYSQELAANPQRVTKPFLLLWEQGFGSHYFPTFSQIAYFDLGVLLLVLALTVWAHRTENISAATQTSIAGTLGAAMDALAIAIEKSVIRPPASAEEWAAAAQRIIADAMRETEQLAAASRQAIESAGNALEGIHVQGRKFVEDFARTSMDTLKGVREENKQFITQTAADARDVLQQAANVNRQLIEQQMNPLIEQLRGMVTEFGTHHETYRVGVEKLSGGVKSLDEAAVLLGRSASSYTTTATSIDQHLQSIETSQGDFITKVTQSVNSLGTSATAMHEVSEVLRKDLRNDLAQIGKNITESSAGLAAVDRNLTSTSTGLNKASFALSAATKELHGAAETLQHGLVVPSSWWRRRR
jgi:hypothetical protein